MTKPSAPLTDVTAADLMSRSVLTLDPDLPVAEAFAQLGDDGIGGAPVLDAAGRVIGVFSVQDVAGNAEHPGARFAAERLYAGSAADEEDFTPDDSDLEALGSARVRDWMSVEVISVAPGATLPDVCRAFTDADVHRLVVLDGDALVGILSTMDIVRFLAR